MYSSKDAHTCSKNYLVWDYQRGEVICTKCGMVVEERLLIETSSKKEKIRDNIKMYNQFISNYNNIIRNKNIKYNKFKKILNKLRKINSLTKKTQGNLIKIDEESFEQYVRTGSSVLVIKKTSKQLEQIFSDPEIKSIVERKIKKNPRLNSRTFRSKVAIALIIKEMEAGKTKLSLKDLREIAVKTGTSVSHVKRLYYMVKNR